MNTKNETNEQLIRDLQNQVADLKRLATNLTEAATRSRDKELSWVYAMEGNRDGVWDWNALTNEVFFSPRWKAMLGFDEDEITNELSEWDKRIHPDDSDSVYADLNAHLDGKTPYYENEHRIQCKNGSYIWILDRGKILSWTEEGKPLRVVGTHTDVTLKKEAEFKLENRTRELIDANIALKDSEEKFRSLSEAAFEGIAIIDQKTIIDANKTIAKMFGYKLSKIIGMKVIDFVSPEERGRVENKILSNDEQPYESIGLKNDGSIFPMEVHARVFSYKGQKVRVSAVRDLTDQKKAEEEIKTLRGILPICASCKNIRDDKGYWNQIEAYIRDHSEAEFSHSICPDCAKKLYPDLFDKDGILMKR